MKNRLLVFFISLMVSLFASAQSHKVTSNNLAAYYHDYETKEKGICEFHVEVIPKGTSFYIRFCIEYDISPNGSKWKTYSVGENQLCNISADFIAMNKYNVSIMLDEYIPNSSNKYNENSRRIVLQNPISNPDFVHVLIAKKSSAEFILHGFNKEEWNYLVNFFKGL